MEDALRAGMREGAEAFAALRSRAIRGHVSLDELPGHLVGLAEQMLSALAWQGLTLATLHPGRLSVFSTSGAYRAFLEDRQRHQAGGTLADSVSALWLMKGAETATPGERALALAWMDAICFPFELLEPYPCPAGVRDPGLSVLHSYFDSADIRVRGLAAPGTRLPAVEEAPGQCLRLTLANGAVADLRVKAARAVGESLDFDCVGHLAGYMAQGPARDIRLRACGDALEFLFSWLRPLAAIAAVPGSEGLLPDDEADFSSHPLWVGYRAWCAGDTREARFRRRVVEMLSETPGDSPAT